MSTRPAESGGQASILCGTRPRVNRGEEGTWMLWIGLVVESGASLPPAISRPRKARVSPARRLPSCRLHGAWEAVLEMSQGLSVTRKPVDSAPETRALTFSQMPIINEDDVLPAWESVQDRRGHPPPQTGSPFSS